MKLQEQAATIQERAKKLTESASRYYEVGLDSDERAISLSCKRLVESIGAEESVKLADRIMQGPREAKKVREALYGMERSGILRESIASTTMGQLLRVGVQDILTNAYKQVPVIWESIVRSVPSDAAYNIIANTFMPTIPGEVQENEEIPESTFDPMGVIKPNIKIATRLKIPQELVDDDQTSQIGQKVSQFAPTIAYWHEIAFAAYLSDTAVTVANRTVTPDTYTDPDGTTGLYVTSTSSNRCNALSAASPTVANVSSLRQYLETIKQPDGQQILVEPDTIVFTPKDQTLIESTFKPNANTVWVTTSSTTKLSDSTQVTTTNPLAGSFKLAMCRFLPAGAWYLGQAQSFSLLWFNRMELQVMHASADAGDSFKYYTSDWRALKRGRMCVAPGGSRFWGQGHA